MKKIIIGSLGAIILGVIALGSIKMSSKPAQVLPKNVLPTSQAQQTSAVLAQTNQPTATPTTATPAVNAYTLADVSKHTSESDCWMAIDGNVYNVTSFIPNHPGGRQMLLGCGKDASSMFNGIHSSQARSLLPQFLIGKLGK